MATWGQVKSFSTGPTLEFRSTGGTALLTLDSANANVVFPNGPTIGTMTRADIDAQSGTITVAHMAGGLLVHTSVTGAGTLTTPTGAEIAAAFPELDTAGRYLDLLVVNDGDQTVTPTAGASGVTIVDTGQTIVTNESAILRFHCTAAATYNVYCIG